MNQKKIIRPCPRCIECKKPKCGECKNCKNPKSKQRCHEKNCETQNPRKNELIKEKPTTNLVRRHKKKQRLLVRL